MDQDKLWARFEKSGKVTDYLKYCGVDVMGDNAVEQENTQPNETDDRRTHHSGKQQYR